MCLPATRSVRKATVVGGGDQASFGKKASGRACHRERESFQCHLLLLLLTSPFSNVGGGEIDTRLRNWAHRKLDEWLDTRLKLFETTPCCALQKLRKRQSALGDRSVQEKSTDFWAGGDRLVYFLDARGYKVLLPPIVGCSRFSLTESIR